MPDMIHYKWRTGNDNVFVSTTNKPTARLVNKPVSYSTRVMRQAEILCVIFASSSYLIFEIHTWMTAYFEWPESDLWPVLATSIDFRFQFALQLCYAGPSLQSLLICIQLAFCFETGDNQSFVSVFTCAPYPAKMVTANRIVSTAETLREEPPTAHQVATSFTDFVYADIVHK
jgi:hypothetical protein